MLKKVISIDDDEISLVLHEIMIKNSAFAEEVASFKCGSKALKFFAGLHSEEATPEVVFLDLNMPVMDGWQFLDEFENKYFRKFPDVYFVILSSSINPDDQKRANEHKLVDKFVSKPLSPESLEEIYLELQKKVPKRK